MKGKPASVVGEPEKINVASFNENLREAYGFEDIDTRPLEAELDARSRGYLSKTDLSDSSFSSLLPSNKTVGDVLFDGKINEALAEIELQGQRVSVLAESPNGFRAALKDLIEEGATPDEVVRALEAYDTIGGDTPSRFQELVEEGLEDGELASVGAVMESYFSKKERLQGLVREEAALDASDAFRLGDSSDSLLGVQEQVLPSNRSFRGGDSDVLQSTEAKIRDFVERDAYDKTPEERQKIADAMLTAARSEAIKTLDQPDVMESLLGVSWEGTVPPDSKSVAQLFSQPPEVIEAAINCLTKEF